MLPVWAYRWLLRCAGTEWCGAAQHGARPLSNIMMIEWYVVYGGSCALASAHRQSSFSSRIMFTRHVINDFIISLCSHSFLDPPRPPLSSSEPNSPMVSTQQSFQTSLDSLPLVVVADRDRLSNLLTSQLSMPCMFAIRETKR